MKKLLKVMSTFCIIGGIVLIFGTEGESYIGEIEFSQILTQAITGLGILFLGCGIRKVVS